MPMSAEVLGPMLQAAMAGVPEPDRADLSKTMKALAGAIIAHIQTAGVVTIVFGPAPPASVVAAPPGGGPIVGTGLGLIT